MGIVGSFQRAESSGFEFRGEAFHALNMVNLCARNRYANEPQFVRVTLPTTPGREIPLCAHLSF